MMAWLQVILLSACWLTSEPAKSQHETNGGHYITIEFATKARLIAEYLRQSPDHVLASTIDLNEFERVINMTMVETTISELRDNAGRNAHAVVLPNPLTPGFLKIVLYAPFWRDAVTENMAVYRLILHEYLRVMGIADEQGRYSHMLDMTLDDFGRGGPLEISDLINMNLEEAVLENRSLVGWYLVNNYQSYRFQTDYDIRYAGRSSLHISTLSRFVRGHDFGATTQCFDASPYWGQGLHLNAKLKTRGVTDASYGGLWIRVDDAQGNTLSLDNMHNRGVTGNNDWRRADLVVYIEPASSKTICFGALLVGTGDLWVDDMAIVILE